VTLPSHKLAVVPLGGAVGVVEWLPIATPGGGGELPAPLLPPFPPPPPPQLAADKAIKKIVVMRTNAAVNIEIPIFTALLERLSHTRRPLATAGRMELPRRLGDDAFLPVLETRQNST
jgi:hypothetical protein